MHCVLNITNLMVFHFILRILSHKWMKSSLRIIPMRTLYFILYDGVIVFRKISCNRNFSSFSFQFQFFIETWSLLCCRRVYMQDVYLLSRELKKVTTRWHSCFWSSPVSRCLLSVDYIVCVVF
jgi:hypothetical protein